MLLSRLFACIASIGLVPFSMNGLYAQDYPSKPIRVVTTTVGGGSDFTSRLITPGIAAALGQPMVVDNRTAMLSAEAVSKAPPDGYTLLITGSSFWIGPLLQKVPYDPIKDFSPLSQLTREVTILAVHKSVPAKSIKELIALAKARPGELNYSTGAAGSNAHLAMELFKSMAGINIVRVAYKGTGPALTALVSGEVGMTIADAGLVAPHVKAGTLTALAVTSATPSTLAPGIPPIAASGLPGYEVVGMGVIFAPARTPSSIMQRLHQEIVRVIHLPEVKEKFFNVGAEVVGSTPDQFAATIKSEMTKWEKVIKEAGIKVE